MEGDNSTGMAIKPAGILDNSGPYDFAGEASFMWSSSQSSQSQNAWYRYVLGENSMIGREDANKEAFLSPLHQRHRVMKHFLSLLGIGIVAIPTGLISAAYVRSWRNEARYKGKTHPQPILSTSSKSVVHRG